MRRFPGVAQSLLNHCCGLNGRHPHKPPNHMWSPMIYIADVIFGDGAFREVIKVKWGHKGGALIWWEWRVYRKGRTHQKAFILLRAAHRAKAMWGHSQKEPGASQGESSHQNPTLLAPWAWTSSHQNWKMINVCCWEPPACGIALWQRRLADTVTISCIFNSSRTAGSGLSTRNQNAQGWAPEMGTGSWAPWWFLCLGKTDNHGGRVAHSGYHPPSPSLSLPSSITSKKKGFMGSPIKQKPQVLKGRLPKRGIKDYKQN